MPDEELVLVRRVYVTPERWDSPQASAREVGDAELWCISCCSQYPHARRAPGDRPPKAPRSRRGPGDRLRSSGVAAAVQLAGAEVVPPAVGADLDDVAVELVVLRPQLLELAGIREAAAVRVLEPVAVDVGDVVEVAAGADRALDPARSPTLRAARISSGCASHTSLRLRTRAADPGARPVGRARSWYPWARRKCRQRDAASERPPSRALRMNLGRPASLPCPSVCDTTSRYIGSIYRSSQTGRLGQAPRSLRSWTRGVHDRVGAGDSRAAAGAAPPRLRAQEAAERDARLLLGDLVRLALSRRCAGSSAAGPSRSSTAARPRARGPFPAIPATGSLKGEAAAARLRLVPAPTGRRTRKAYRITPFGQEQFLALLTADDAGDDERLFSLKLAFCRFLDPAAAPRVPRAPAHRARRPPGARGARAGRRSIATRAPSWSTAPDPPSATSSGSTT